MLSQQVTADAYITEHGIEQLLDLAERLRATNGGVLDDSAILAIAEATGIPEEAVRVAVKVRGETARKGVLYRWRSTFLSLEPSVKRWVTSGLMAAGIGFAQAFGVFGRYLAARSTLPNPGALMDLLGICFAMFGLYNLAICRNLRTAAVAGVILGAGWFPVYQIFGFILNLPESSSYWIIFWAGLGLIGGSLLQLVVSHNHHLLGLKDRSNERRELLSQLVELQDKLRSGEQSAAFLSVDVVGSTQMKRDADPLNVEFTFTEYHRFVDMVARRYGGRVHSTAGDGMICAFDTAQQAVGAGRNLQVGILEFNALRNKIGVPLRLRAGVHAGPVVAPDAGDLTSVSFAHVIDVAAHLQKVCPIGGLAVSEEAAAQLPGGAASIGTTRVEAGEISGVAWVPRSIAAFAPSPTPPLPRPAQS
ncbi:MAG: hypothetical protein HY248_02020 [Fimbriimonas ginsengisoli]|uniref:Guanylate cyclase domain-containing protein n=1 Tax=Fimbriimonas ginsengisoli TaxID=1005039 RepID=A0A931LU91_FIMGI|nr:hypothetical protein [Fimbriimonas ginsengisoli]MBI3721304.1 hypothetical protein [Fimbriimonas ginsengisoli]